jgi:glucose/arabinose dehydrogenase
VAVALLPSTGDGAVPRARLASCPAMTRRLGAAALVLGAALAACGAGDGTEGSASTAATGTARTSTPSTSATTTAPPARAAQARRGVRLARIGNFRAPLYVTSPPGDPRRLMVVEQGGRIMVVRGGRKLARPFLDISGRVTAGGEQGLLSVAFPPDYQRSGRFYVYFTGGGGADNRIVEFRRSSNSDRAVASSGRLVLSMPNLEPNHNGGLMLFGPDGLMYVGTGDGGGGNDQHGARGNAQDLGSLLGKILRIDPRPSGGRPYRIPSSNPFVGRAGARGEIYAYGLRNPWRFSFDPRTGDLSIGDVGQNAVEEINFMRRGRARGANFGWRPWEGNRRNFNELAPGAVFPVITHTHAAGFCSIIGGYVVRDPTVPSLAGRYVYSDLCDGRIRAARLRAGRRTRGRPLNLPKLSSVSSFGEDARGRVYVTSLAGPVYRLSAPR